MESRAVLFDQLARAESRLLPTRRALERLEELLQAVALPPFYWTRRMRESAQFVERRYARALRDFLSLRSAAGLNNAATPDGTPATGAGSSETKIKSGAIYSQCAEVRVVEGVTVTEVTDCGNEYWVAQAGFPESAIFRRQITFGGASVPEPYVELLERRGIQAKPPPRCVFVSYRWPAFLELCQRELASGEKHFTEGEPFDVDALY